MPALSEQEQLLDAIDHVSRGLRCSSDYSGQLNPSGHTGSRDTSHSVFPGAQGQPEVPGPETRDRLSITSKRIDLLASILSDYSPDSDSYKILRNAIDELVRLDEDIFRVRIGWLGANEQSEAADGQPGSASKRDLGPGQPSADTGPPLSAEYFGFLERKKKLLTESYNKTIPLDVAWLAISGQYDGQIGPQGPVQSKRHQMIGRLLRHGSTFVPGDSQELVMADWTPAYYSCEHKLWLFSYTALVTTTDQSSNNLRLRALLSVDVDISKLDIDQCDDELDEPLAEDQELVSVASVVNVVTTLKGTHKCHKETSQCIFFKGFGWRKGGYSCKCKDGFYSTSAASSMDILGLPLELGLRNSFNGSLVEQAWDMKIKQNGLAYDIMYTCKPCAEGCDTCFDGSPCLSTYNWAFRISLLTVSVICILITMLLGCYIYKWRKLKVFKVASPIFLCITLLGCAMMYLEMAAIFPALDVFCCIVTKWTRHFGFCITYSALLLKTWRVSLTYRVKSAHKLKLTDKQLLQWLFPILLVMAIYLSTWTISAPPAAVYIQDWAGLKFKICQYNWWDHSLAIGEFLFLLWGIKVCYSVRNAESFFNEAKYITWAIYNIAGVNIIMIFLHVLILPHAGPDVKYFFGFVRTQLSTTTTILLIFGPKFYRVLKGQGDTWDNRSRARGINASFSINGVGLVHEETTDLYQENEELKEEIHKLATQIELMKLLHMEMNNRHLKSKHKDNLGSTISSAIHNSPPTVTITANPASGTPSVGTSPLVKALYSRFESHDGPVPRISAAAELVSERV
ncbi:putative G-protein coupled receptor [Halotydeus destructor]|nr:putative G-protein coupled receptor [Halotydeus destructor]